MTIDGWKDRLATAIVESGRSDRDISLSAKPPGKAQLGPGYVHSILKEGKDPTVGNLQAICEALGVSIYRILGGFDMTPETERLLRLLVDAEEGDRRSVLHLLGARPRSRENVSPHSE